MPRELVFGNGKIFVNMDRNLSIRDFYYPRVGLFNHVGGHRHRIGVFANNSFSWLDAGWKKTIRYRKDALVSEVVALNEGLKVELRISDAVHYEKNIFIKKIAVRNLDSRNREITVFFNQDFHICGETLGDTALYDPALDSIIHYKRDTYFLISGGNKDRGIHEYATGLAEFGGSEGTYRDAEDGRLSCNPVAQGSVDSTISFKLDVKKNSEKTFYYWIAVGANFTEVKALHEFVLGRKPETLLNDTEIFWKRWLEGHVPKLDDLDHRCAEVFKTSLMIMRAHSDAGGAIISACDSDALHLGKEMYNYMWPREGAIAAFVFDRLGYHDVSKRFFLFCNRALTSSGFLLHKYAPDGSLGGSWYPWVKSGKSQLPVQEDETALVLYGLWRHYLQHRDVEFVRPLYDTLIRPAADFLAQHRDNRTRLPKAGYDMWGERYGIFSFTCGAVYSGLVGARNFASLFGDAEAEARYAKAAKEIRDAAVKYLYSEKEKRFVRALYPRDGAFEKDKLFDASLFGFFELGFLPHNDARVDATLKKTRERLLVSTAVGGLARYENDPYHQKTNDTKNVAGNPWVGATLLLACWEARCAKTLAQLEEAKKLIAWAAERAQPAGLLPEQLHPYTGEPLSVSPSMLSHLMYALAVLTYLEKWGELKVCEKCGARAAGV
ncbi:MAG: glycoside hydrolase family 15 protein [Candidatus Micrarchaeota archaeon]